MSPTRKITIEVPADWGARELIEVAYLTEGILDGPSITTRCLRLVAGGIHAEQTTTERESQG